MHIFGKSRDRSMRPEAVTSMFTQCDWHPANLIVYIVSSLNYVGNMDTADSKGSDIDVGSDVEAKYDDDFIGNGDIGNEIRDLTEAALAVVWARWQSRTLPS